jgi:hypothetical protein
MNWLDTQTQELLHGAPPPRDAPSKSAEYALILLQKGCDEPRMVRAVTRISDIDPAAAAELISRTPPTVIHRDLRYEDAVLGQFELICCDAPSAVLNAEVLDHGGEAYLEHLFLRILQSTEFKRCQVVIHHIPKTEAGERFADQFLGYDAAELREIVLPLHLETPFKKARIMKHWAGRVGVLLDLPDPQHENKGEDSATRSEP